MPLSIRSPLKLLESYAWPGNVRELKNAIEHALIFAEGSVLGIGDFPQILRLQEILGTQAPCDRSKNSSATPSRRTLEETHYKIGRAAEILGISRKTLLEKRKRYGLM